jgi:hypothetical protein
MSEPDTLELRPRADFSVDIFVNGRRLADLVAASDPDRAGPWHPIHWYYREGAVFALPLLTGERRLLAHWACTDYDLVADVAVGETEVHWTSITELRGEREDVGPFLFARGPYEAAIVEINRHFECSAAFAAEAQRLRRENRRAALACGLTLVAGVLVVAALIRAWW